MVIKYIGVDNDQDVTALRELIRWWKTWKNQLTSLLWSRRRRGGGGEISIHRAQTQAAAGALAYISCKLLDADAVEYGDAFNAYAIFTDGATVLNTCLPRIADDSVILVSKIQGIWYIVNPTLTDSEAGCT